MTEGSDKRVPPDVQALLRTLKAYSVEFVVAGSVAVEAWGADVGVPGDLDIVPATNRRNLERLVNAMQQVDAQSWPVTGRWVSGDGGGTTWEEYVDNDPRCGQPLPDADPDNIETLDSLFSTRHGEMDIVPRISGAYEELIKRHTTVCPRCRWRARDVDRRPARSSDGAPPQEGCGKSRSSPRQAAAAV